MEKIKKNKWLILLILIPLLSIMMIIKFRHEYMPSNDEIIEKIIETNGYKAKINYLFINEKNKYNEEAAVYYDKNDCNKIEFINGIEETYVNERIEIKEEEKNYEIKEEIDKTYSLAFIEKIINNKIVSINEGSEEWGEIEYLIIEVLIPSENKHINKAYVYVNKANMAPIVIRVLDEKNKERMIIQYKEFQYLDDIKND